MTRAKAGRKKIGCAGCFWRLGVLGILALLLVAFIAESVFNLRSNAVYFASVGSREPLQVRLKNGTWKDVGQVSVAELDQALVKKYETDGATFKSLRVRREVTGTWKSLANSLFSAEVNVVELTPERFQFATSFKKGFETTTAWERLDAEQAAFSITANFREPNGMPLGRVVHEGVEHNRTFPNWTGYFFVKDGKPWFGPKSLLEETPGVLQEASQVYPSLMKNHTVFSYVDLAPNRYYDGDKISYRALAGMRQTGQIVFIVSGDGGTMNVSEVAALALKLNVQHATLLDGGRALQYSWRFGSRVRHFHAFNNAVDIDVKGLEAQRSPVFIVAKPVKTN